jgi:hypothetical protein
LIDIVVANEYLQMFSNRAAVVAVGDRDAVTDSSRLTDLQIVRRLLAAVADHFIVEHLTLVERTAARWHARFTLRDRSETALPHRAAGRRAASRAVHKACTKPSVAEYLMTLAVNYLELAERALRLRQLATAGRRHQLKVAQKQ